MNGNTTLRAKKLILINRDFQLRYAKVGALIGVLSAFLTTVFVFVPLYQFEIIPVDRQLPTPVWCLMIGGMLANIGMTIVFGIFVSHRIAGPMFSIVRRLRMIELGMWNSPMRIREHDDMDYIVRNYNEMVGGLLLIAKEDLSELEIVQSEDKIEVIRGKVSHLAEKIRHRTVLRTDI
jgi:hypothetical protein